MMKKSGTVLFTAIAITAAALTSGCDDSKSYAELLTEEGQAINNYLVNHRVETTLPENNNFIVGEDAPFYQLDEEGNVYMQVIDPGNPEYMAELDEQIYFRFTRWSLLNYEPFTGYLPEGWGNNDDLSLGSSSFRFGNYTLSSSSTWGSGIQMPLNYIALESRVKLIIRSQYGLSSEISNVTPFLYDVRYLKQGATGSEE